MSEQPKDWTKVVREIFKEEAAAILKALPPLEKNGETVPSANKHKPHSLADLLDCPDCYPTIKKGVLEKEILSRKDKELECVDCGTRVDETEESCPTCGGKDARHR